MSTISNLVRKATKQNGKLNILTFFYDGKFDVELLQTGHEFYGCLEHSAWQWPGYTNAQYKNLHVLRDISEINNVDVDLVIFNSRERQNQFFGICRQLHAPGLIIDHDTNHQNAFFRAKNKQFTPFPNISTSEHVQQQYGSDICINYRVVPKAWESQKDIDILCTVSLQHDMGLINTIKQNFPSAVFIGHHPNLPYAAQVETFEDYKGLFRRARLFVNIAPQEDINHDILYALNNSVPIVTYERPVYKGLLEQNVNAIQVSSPEEIISKIKELSFDKSLYNKISNYKTNLTKFDQSIFLRRWREELGKHASRVYIE
jgi:hypothetical protein